MELQTTKVSAMRFRFEKFDIWHRAIDYADLVYDVTEHFPMDERFGLTSQMRRAAVSISSNIAEGSSRSSRADFARFIEYSYGSLLEVVSQARIANRRRFLSDQDRERLDVEADELLRMLSAFKNSLLK